MISRRYFLMASLGLLAAARDVFASGAKQAQILLVRAAKQPITCGKVQYIPGGLYGVPPTVKLEDVNSSFGLEFLTRVEELAYLDNASRVSSIAPGVYNAIVRDDASKKWMTNINRRWRLELLGTESRSNIQFHYGLDYKWSEGCIIVTGDSEAGLVCRSQSETSEKAIERLRQYVSDNSNSSPPARVKIIFATS